MILPQREPMTDDVTMWEQIHVEMEENLELRWMDGTGAMTLHGDVGVHELHSSDGSRGTTTSTTTGQELRARESPRAEWMLEENDAEECSWALFKAALARTVRVFSGWQAMLTSHEAVSYSFFK